MSHKTATDGPYFGSGSISWSQIRSTFNPTGDSNNIKASDYIRKTDTGIKNPLLPDATENNAVPSSQSNWKASQLRNTIRFYYVTQYGEQYSSSPAYTDINTFTRDGPGTTDGSNGGVRWNGNLPKNIVKTYTLTGICGSMNSAWPAMQALGTVYNLSVFISGQVYGASGNPGTGGIRTPSTAATVGGDGGNCVVFNTNGSPISVKIQTGAKLYAGGGGGAGGGLGPDGTAGRCTASTTVSGCGGVGGCPAPYSDGGTYGGNCCQTYCQWCGWGFCNCQPCSKNTQIRRCNYDQPSTQGLGGNGGNGGRGRGYDNQSASLSGSSGSPGTCPTCSFGTLSGGSCGQTGRTGGSGGDWGSSGGSALGQNPAVVRSGGNPGKAMTGSSYQLTSDSDYGGVKGALS